MAADERNMPFIKNLASSDRKTRTSALSTLRTFLSAPATAQRLSDLDHLKLWKGLFYSVWMCDRPIPQQNLCAELAGLLAVLPTHNPHRNGDGGDAADEGEDGGPECAVVVPFLRAFWATLAREWTAIDVLRMEKYLLLVRRVFGASLAWVGEGYQQQRRQKKGAKATKEMKKWTGPRADAMLALLREWPLEASGNLAKVPVGLRLHVVDIWVDEVERLGLLEADEGSEADEDGGARFVARIRRVVEVQTKSACKPVRVRAKESLADERLPWNRTSDDEDEDEEMAEDGDRDGRDSWDGFDD
ncbi:hypothetical protein AAE478_002505 [Parahypoxylon ruwenzoriense]